MFVSQKSVSCDQVFKAEYINPTIIGLVRLCSLCNQIFVMTQKQYCVPQSEGMIKVSLGFSFPGALHLNKENRVCSKHGTHSTRSDRDIQTGLKGKRQVCPGNPEANMKLNLS